MVTSKLLISAFSLAEDWADTKISFYKTDNVREKHPQRMREELES